MTAEKESLAVLWTSGDREVALKMAFLYTLNAKRKGWWKEVTLIVWGPSAQLLSQDTEVQDGVARMREAGVVLEACKACADMYGVAPKLESLGIEVRYMGEALTNYLRKDKTVLAL